MKGSQKTTKNRIEEITLNKSEKIALKSFTCAHFSELMLIAEDGRIPPLVALAELSPPIPADVSPSKVRSYLQQLLDDLFLKKGVEIYEKDTKAGGPEWINGKANTYYKPSDNILYNEVITNEQSLVYVVTKEEERIVQSFFRKLGEYNPDTPIFIWTHASGIYQAEYNPEKIIYHRFEKICVGQMTSNLTVLLPDDDNYPTEIVSEILTNNADALKNIRIKNHVIRLLAGGDNTGERVFLIVDGHSEVDRSEIFEALSNIHSEMAKDEQERLQEYLKDQNIKNQMGTTEFSNAIRYAIEHQSKNGVFLFLDSHHHLNEHSPYFAKNVRILKDAFYGFRHSEVHKRILLFGANVDIPKELAIELRRVDVPVPGRRELFIYIGNAILNLRAVTTIRKQSKTEFDSLVGKCVDAALGLTLLEVDQIIKAELANQYLPLELLPSALQAEKNRSISMSGILEFIPERELVAVDVRGVEQLQKWLDIRQKVFLDPEGAKRFGLDRRPKGILMLGIPGTGKSLFAKYVAKTWTLPLIRLDAGAIFNKYVGSSEERVRDALATIERLSPCVLWIDEIEKGFGDSSNKHETSQRVIGTLLTWLQESRAPVFMVATANDVDQIPAELMRAGRFDGRFFFGCPDTEGRKQILDFHLEKRKQVPDDFDIGKLADLSLGFTGAEIEQAVLDALYEAFKADEDENKKLTDDLLIKAITHTKPLIKVVGPRLERMWQLIEEGQVENASDNWLTRSEVRKIIDPFSYMPMYCRKERIKGYEKEGDRAEQIAASRLEYGRAVCVLELEDPDWLYAHCNFPMDPSDGQSFKFLDRIVTIEQNNVFHNLHSQNGLNTILFTSSNLENRFRNSTPLSALQHLFEVVQPDIEINIDDIGDLSDEF